MTRSTKTVVTNVPVLDQRNTEILERRAARHKAGLDLAVSPCEGRSKGKPGRHRHGKPTTVYTAPSEGQGTFADQMYAIETQFVRGERVIGDKQSKVAIEAYLNTASGLKGQE